MGQSFGLSFGEFRKMLSQLVCDNPVEFAPARLEQRFVRRVLDQRVLERVHRLWRDSANVKQFRVGQFAQRVLEILFGNGVDRMQQLVGKFAAYYGADL